MYQLEEGQEADFKNICSEWDINEALWENVKDLEFTSPKPKYVFNAFKIGENESIIPPDKVKVLIIGQDPYPDPEKAQGFAFSCNKGKAQSLTKIFKAVNIYNKSSKNFDYNLITWAIKNKILLLNTALTYEKSKLYWGKKKSDLSETELKDLEKDQNKILKRHVGAWKEFIVCIIEQLIAKNKNIVVFLWGDKAHDLFKKCKNNEKIKHIFETCHPRKRLNKEIDKLDKFLQDAPNHFEACDKLDVSKNIWKNLPEK